MPQPKGTIQVEMLDDGRLKVETGDMSGPAHRQADNFFEFLTELLGEEVSREKVAHAHTHHHHHTHETHKH